MTYSAMTEDSSSLGGIVTFYSYKGGTGRSMALANTACWLAKRLASPSRKVLVADWDLEAPGLHRFFEAKAELPENKDCPGVINYFDKLQELLEEDQTLYSKLASAEEAKALGDLIPINDYIISDVVPGVDLMKAGRLDGQYAELIGKFNWANFYTQYGGVIEPFRNLLASTYAHVLIDSRTGFTDISGICTMLMPEKLVVVFTPNSQSLSGVLDLARRSTEYRRTSDDFRPLSVFPLPSRIETAEKELRKEWRQRYQHQFETVFRNIYQLENCDLTAYFNEVQLPHEAYYAYGEKIALLEERSDSLSLSRAYEVFCERLIDLDFPWDTVAEEEALVAISDFEKQALAPEAPVSRPIKGRESDIFISYAHIDDSPMFGSMSGWVDLFHERLQMRLAQLLGREPRIWRDRKLGGNDLFSDGTAIELANAGILILILSPRYLQSSACRRELEDFLRLADRDGLRVNDKHRVFKVMKTYVPLEEHPPELRDLLGYEFYERDAGSGRVREFDYEIAAQGKKDQRYWDRFEDLAWDIQEVITRLEDREPRSPGPPAATVYLAETTSDLTEERNKVKRELQQYGHQVLPDEQLPLAAPALEEAVRNFLKRSQLSVHLIGAHYGIIPEMETERSVVRLQLELATEHDHDSEFSRLIWIPPGLQPQDERQQKFIGDLQHSFTSDNSELLQVKLEDLKTIIQTKLARRLRPKPLQTEIRRPTLLYLICDQLDTDAVEPLRDCLFDRGYEVILPLREGSEAEVLEDHKENLLVCDAVLIFQGRASEVWLRMKLRELLKLPGYGRTTPLLGKAVYLGPPKAPWKERFKTLEASVIKNYDRLNPDLLGGFFAQIDEATGKLP
jgi:cellulose biosynthesis protein BcsQ